MEGHESVVDLEVGNDEGSVVDIDVIEDTNDTIKEKNKKKKRVNTLEDQESVVEVGCEGSEVDVDVEEIVDFFEDAGKETTATVTEKEVLLDT